MLREGVDKRCYVLRVREEEGARLVVMPTNLAVAVN